MNTQNYLAASDLAYKKLNEKEFVDGMDGIKYEVVKALHTPSGYDGYILHRADTNELIVAHRGTWPEKGALTADVLSDLGMAVDQTNNQYPDAKRLTEMAVSLSQSEYKGAVIRQTGHSLGGTLAQLCGYNYGHQTETFNAYGAADLKEKGHGRQNNAALITNHVRATDPVSAASPHLGKVEHYLNKNERAMLYGGGYGGGLNAIRPNFPWQVATSGLIWDHGLANFEQGGLSAADRRFAAENRELVKEFRTEFEKEAKEAGGDVKYIKDKVNGAVDWSKNILNISADSNTHESQLARAIAAVETNGRLPAEARSHTGHLAAAPSAVQTAQVSQSKYDEVRAMLTGLLNDTDGSYAQKVLAEHPEQVARFEEKVRQSMERDRLQELAANRESQAIQQEEQQRSFSRSLG